MSILYLHLTDGTEIITFAEATTTGSLRLFQPKRVTLSFVQGEVGGEVTLQWQIGDIHPLQTLSGVNPLNELRADNILYSFGDQQIPAGMLKDYTEMVMPKDPQPAAQAAEAQQPAEAPAEQPVENAAPAAEVVEVPQEAPQAEQPAEEVKADPVEPVGVTEAVAAPEALAPAQ